MITFKRLVTATGVCLLAVVSNAEPSRATTAYVTPEATVVRVAAATPKSLEARSRSWLVSNAIRLCSTAAHGVLLLLR